MNKLKTVFQRSSQKQRVIEDRRPQQFVKRHSSVATPIPSTPNSGSMYDNNPPAIGFEDLSEPEKPAYESWWKDLDPFDLKKINNQTVLKFLGGCSLQDNKLEQILALFETAGDGLNKLQFFAMLRLIAHAQNGRKISRALVYLGAPVPHFHRNAIDALIKSDMVPQRQPLSDAINGTNDKENLQENGLEMIPNATKHQRKSWWGNEKQLQSDHRRSYMGPFTAHTPIPNTTYTTSTTTTTTSTSESDTSMQDYFYQIPSIPNHNTNINSISNTPNHQWPHISPQPPLTIETSATTPHANNMIRPIFTSAMTTTATITPVTPNIIQLEEKQQYTHNRSRSAGNPSDFIHHNPYELQATAPTMVSEDQLHSSRSSLSLHELNTGQSLLLTQKFVYQSPSVRNQELSSANPFNQAEEPPLKSPFGDENHSDEDDYVAAIEPPSIHLNHKPNQFSIPPPAVPTQSTKPAFPKYTRTNTFLVKRSLSTAVAVDRHKDEQLHFTKHQRHKSTSATHDIFY
ncbi:unnamed protein product [Mucor fragilis]